MKQIWYLCENQILLVCFFCICLRATTRCSTVDNTQLYSDFLQLGMHQLLCNIYLLLLKPNWIFLKQLQGPIDLHTSSGIGFKEKNGKISGNIGIYKLNTNDIFKHQQLSNSQLSKRTATHIFVTQKMVTQK